MDEHKPSTETDASEQSTIGTVINLALIAIGCFIFLCLFNHEWWSWSGLSSRTALLVWITSGPLAGRGLGGFVTLEGVYTWSRRWADAQADGAPLNEQVKAYMAHRDRMQKLFDKVKQKHDIGVVGGEKDKYEAARYYVAEANSRLPKSLRDAAAPAATH